MELTNKELWTVIHGMILGSIYLLAFTGGFTDLWNLKPQVLTDKGISSHIRRLCIGMWIMAIISWLAVLTGTYILYPWYREGGQAFLMDNPKVTAWDTFGMEWKVHIGWIAPILMTAVAFIVSYYRSALISFPSLRRVLLILFLASFAAAGISAVFGAFITKIAPINLGDFVWKAQKIIAK